MKIQNIPINQVKDAIRICTSKRQVLSHFGENPKNGNQMLLLSNLIAENKIDISHFYENTNLIVDEVIAFVKISKSYHELCKHIKQGSPFAYAFVLKVKRFLAAQMIDTSHFSSVKTKNNRRYKDAEIWIENSSVTQQTLKARYLKFREHEYYCDRCNTDEWLGEPIVLQLDHVDGNSHDNRKSNLRLLCPNCHSQTPTFCRAKSH